MKKKLDKASVHNGRANSKGVAYNANHNTMELSREHQPHIDPDRIHLNRYIQYLDGGTAIAHKGGEGGYDSRKHEVDRYKQLYGEGLDARNKRYIASGGIPAKFKIYRCVHYTTNSPKAQTSSAFSAAQ